MAAAAHARLAQSYAVGTLYLPLRHVPNRSDGANLPLSPAMARRLRKAVTTPTDPPIWQLAPRTPWRATRGAGESARARKGRSCFKTKAQCETVGPGC